MPDTPSAPSQTDSVETAHAHTVGLHGIDGTMVLITASVGSPDGVIVELPNSVHVRETKDRVRAAIRNSDLPWMAQQVTIRVSSPELHSASMDLAVACAMLAADGQIPADALDRVVLVGELALNGEFRPVRCLLPALRAARRARHDLAIVPTRMLAEAALVPGIRVLGADCLADVVSWLQGSGGDLSSPVTSETHPRTVSGPLMRDLGDVVGQPEAVRAVEVAAAGGHHLLFVGAHGAGATLLAHCLPDLLPPLSEDQALEIASIRSLAGVLPTELSLTRRPPFVAPHNSCSPAAFVGGGRVGMPRPGAISQAHHGVLFLEDAPQHDSTRFETLRTVLDQGEIRLVNARGVVCYPARFQLVLATSPCPCGRPEPDCLCTPHVKRRYLSRIAGHLLDRIDLRVRLRPPNNHSPDGAAAATTSVVRARVAQARRHAADRWAALRHQARTNATVPDAVFGQRQFQLPNTVAAPLHRALETGALTARGALRTMRVAWTLADLAELERPGREQIAEALEFRDRKPR